MTAIWHVTSCAGIDECQILNEITRVHVRGKRCRQDVSLTRQFKWSGLNGVTCQKTSSPATQKKSPIIFEKQRFINVFTTAPIVSSSSATYIESTPSQHIPLRSILVLFSRIRLGIPSGLLSSSFFTITLNEFLFCPVPNSRAAQLVFLDQYSVVV